MKSEHIKVGEKNKSNYQIACIDDRCHNIDNAKKYICEVVTEYMF